jgi:hypothetical protein
LLASLHAGKHAVDGAALALRDALRANVLPGFEPDLEGGEIFAVRHEAGETSLEDHIAVAGDGEHGAVEGAIDLMVVLCEPTEVLEGETSSLGFLPKEVSRVDVLEAQTLAHEPCHRGLATAGQSGNRDQHRGIVARSRQAS